MSIERIFNFNFKLHIYFYILSIIYIFDKFSNSFFLEKEDLDEKKKKLFSFFIFTHFYRITLYLLVSPILEHFVVRGM